jgi:hypothetical protein
VCISISFIYIKRIIRSYYSVFSSQQKLRWYSPCFHPLDCDASPPLPGTVPSTTFFRFSQGLKSYLNFSIKISRQYNDIFLILLNDFLSILGT